MKRILQELGHSYGDCSTLMCDNNSTIKLSKILLSIVVTSIMM